jgi:NAD(P)-dependent dehydrogenase (short-subunit alcohol dehydrogenase family)
MSKLDGKVALITGAASGIGRATAVLFAREGAKVAVGDYVPAGGQETVRMIKEAGGEAIFVKVDVSKATELEKMVKAVVDRYGRIDILFNNAGIGSRKGTLGTTEDEWDRVINTNLKSVFLGSKYVIPTMLAQGGGVIINTASIAGIMGIPNEPAYCASKAGVIQLTKAMATEFGHQNIRVNCICPGSIQTALTEGNDPARAAARATFLQQLPLNRMGKADEIARAALYLASDDSSYITGAALAVDGGSTIGRSY